MSMKWIRCEVTTRDRHTIVYIEYSRNRQKWFRSGVKIIGQNVREVVKIKVDGLLSGKVYYYRAKASGEVGAAHGNENVLTTK